MLNKENNLELPWEISSTDLARTPYGVDTLDPFVGGSARCAAF